MNPELKDVNSDCNYLKKSSKRQFLFRINMTAGINNFLSLDFFISLPQLLN